MIMATTSKAQPPRLRGLNDFANALAVLEARTPERVTTSQLLFFVLAGIASLEGDPATFVEIRDAVGGDFAVSIHTTYKVFLEPSRQFPKATGWLRRKVDPLDQRRKFLHLTPTGKMVLEDVMRAGRMAD